MRIRRPSQPAVPPSPRGGKGIKQKAGNVRGARGAGIKTKSLPTDPGGKPQPKAGNTRGAREALRLKDLLVGASDGFQGNQGIGNTRARRPDSLKPQGIDGGRDGFEALPTSVGPARRDSGRRPIVDSPGRLPVDEFQKIGGGNNLGTRGSIKIR